MDCSLITNVLNFVFSLNPFQSKYFQTQMPCTPIQQPATGHVWSAGERPSLVFLLCAPRHRCQTSTSFFQPIQQLECICEEAESYWPFIVGNLTCLTQFIPISCLHFHSNALVRSEETKDQLIIMTQEKKTKAHTLLCLNFSSCPTSLIV